MNAAMRAGLHPVLLRQLRRTGVDPSDPALAELLGSVSRAYSDADQERYTMERSLSIVSDEMQELYEGLRVRTAAIHEATIEASVDGVAIVDEKRELLSINRAFLDIWAVEEVAVSPGVPDVLRDVFAGKVADPQGVLARIKDIDAAPTTRARDEVHLADGRVLDQYTAPIVDGNGRVLGRVWFVRDVTEHKKHEAQLRAARDDAEAASRAKTAFLANMSHELRTPLNSILGFGRLLRRNSMLESQRKQLDFILAAGEHMLTLVNDLLDLRKIEDGAATLTHAVVNVREAVRQACSFVEPLPTDRQQVISTAVPDDLRVRGDSRALVQILVNLLSNAAKFTAVGGRISVHAARVGSRVEVAVEDSGMGIPAGGLEKLFTYYAQIDGKADHGLKGSGIGLALTRALVHRLGGEIGVRSTPGAGSTFHFALDAA